MERKPYSAGAVKFSFWFMEFRKTVQLLSEGMFFEILPAFKNGDGSYRYPDTNMGRNWRSTNPKA